jgi:hypothetical protein
VTDKSTGHHRWRKELVAPMEKVLPNQAGRVLRESSACLFAPASTSPVSSIGVKDGLRPGRWMTARWALEGRPLRQGPHRTAG